MIKYILGGVLAVGVLAVGVQVATQALFTDTQSVGANTFSTGTVDIATTPATALVSAGPIAPGDPPVYGAIDVSNDGSLELRYALKSTTTENSLAPQLALTIRGPAASGVGCDDPGFATYGTGEIYTGAGGGPLGNTTGINIIGDPAQGAQAGDRILTGGASEFLCFKVDLPLLSTDNTAQGKTTTATFDFISEQTANN